MKNTIPLVIAAALGLVAVFAVSRMIRPKDSGQDDRFVWVVSAAKDIGIKDGPIKESWLMKKKAEQSSLPAKAIPWNQMNRVVGQNTVRTISRNDYVLSSDVAGMEIRLDGTLAEGEWAVPITFSDGALVRFLQPGDEIAILATSVSKKLIQKKDMSEKAESVEERTTSVVFPCVRILDVGKGDGIRRDDDGGNGTVIVALSPQQAATIVAAQRQMELFPALRRSNDMHSMKRKDVGAVTDATLDGLKAGLEPIVIPDTTSKK